MTTSTKTPNTSRTVQMNPVKETKNERYVKPEVQDIASLSAGLVLHGGNSAEGSPEQGGEGGGQDED